MKEFVMNTGHKMFVNDNVIPTLEKRKKIVEEYCKSKGWNQAELTIPQVLEIRKLPEWINV